MSTFNNTGADLLESPPSHKFALEVLLSPAYLFFPLKKKPPIDSIGHHNRKTDAFQEINRRSYYRTKDNTNLQSYSKTSYSYS